MVGIVLKWEFSIKEKVQVSPSVFGLRIAPPKGLRSKGGGLKFFVNLEKWKISDLLCLMTRPNCLKRKEIML